MTGTLLLTKQNNPFYVISAPTIWANVKDVTIIGLVFGSAGSAGMKYVPSVILTVRSVQVYFVLTAATNLGVVNVRK